MRRLVGFAVALALLACLPAQAHEVRPAFLELREIQPGTWQADWRVPARGEMRLRLDPRLPAACANVAPPIASMIGGMNVQRWQMRCEGELAGQEIAIEGLKRTMTDAIVRIVPLSGAEETARLVPAMPAFTVSGSATLGTVARTYVVLGIEHILLGIDHLLFVLALVLIVPGFGPLVKAITAFTVAHSITLAAATLGWVTVPVPPVEAVIALSIVFLAMEIVHSRQGRFGLAFRKTWLVAFVFGLLHGFGFASALSEVGLPSDAIPAALLFFNVGVELGQLAFIAVALPVLAMARRLPLAGREWAWRVPVYAIGAVAGFWVIERVAGFWT